MVVVYTDNRRGDAATFIRSFSSTVSETELVWHRDKLPRTVRVLEGSGWRLQIDNRLPEDLVVGSEYQIPDHHYHRLWRGNTDLILEITEHGHDGSI